MRVVGKLGRKVTGSALCVAIAVWSTGLGVSVAEGYWGYVFLDASLIVLGILQLRDLDRRCVDCQRSHEEVMASRRAE